MMIIVNRTGDSISGSYNGIPFGVSYDETKYAEMKRIETLANAVETFDELKILVDEFEPLTKESYKELVETKCEWVYVNKATNKFYLKTPQGRISSKALPKALVDRMIESVDKKIDVMPLVKCFIRFLRNPKYTDAKAKKFAWYINQTHTNPKLKADLIEKGLHEDVAKERATSMQTPITQEGLLMTYKVSEEIDWKWVLDEDGNKLKKSRYTQSIDDITGLITYDKPAHAEDFVFRPAVMHDGGDEFFCGDKKGHVIRVGFAHFLENWDQVDTNDNHSCVPGLHCGNQDYIRSYQTAGTVTHNIFVDPMDIGAIVEDNTGALRVRRYFVHSTFEKTNKAIYNSSKYAAMTDEEYRKMLDEAITATGELKDQADNDLEDKKALID